MFGFLAGFYYWFPKMTGRRLDPGLAKLHFWLFEIGFVGVFMPLFYAGIKGEPRWQAYIDPKFGTQNLISSLFVIAIMASVAVFGYNVLYSWLRGARAEANEWGGTDARMDYSQPGSAGQLRASRGRIRRARTTTGWADRGRWVRRRSPARRSTPPPSRPCRT